MFVVTADVTSGMHTLIIIMKGKKKKNKQQASHERFYTGILSGQIIYSLEGPKRPE